MKRLKGLILATILPVSGVFLASCVGDSDSKSEDTASATSAIGAQVSASALSVTDMALTAASGEAAQDVGLRKRGDLAKSVAGFNKGMRARRARAVAAAVEPQEACNGGGTVVSDATSTTFSDCVYLIGSAKFYFDGTVSYTETDSGFSAVTGSSTDPYVMRVYQVNGTVEQLVLEIITQVTFSGSYGATTTCGGVSVPTSTTITMNGSISYKEYEEDGTPVDDGSASFSDLALTVSSSEFDTVTCEPAVAHVTMSGGVSNTDNLDSSQSTSMSIASGTPLTIHWEQVGTIAELEISGTVTIDSSCFDGTLTIATTTPIQIADGDSCPIAGVVTVTGSMTGTITYNSNGSVSIDEGSNGSVDQTLADCDEAETCS